MLLPPVSGASVAFGESSVEVPAFGDSYDTDTCRSSSSLQKTNI